MSKVLVDRDRVVESMCLTWRHDFGLDKLEGCDFCSGMTDKEREHLRGQMGKLFDHHFAPALSAVTAERDRLESTLIQTTTRHFAQQWKDRADDKKLDECLSEGIAMLEAERDRLRDAAGKAIAWLDAEQNGSGVGINRRIKLCRDAENSLRAAIEAAGVPVRG